jgi:hypothetical protein
MSSAVMAHLLQLDRPDATPRLPATTEAATPTHPSLTVRDRIVLGRNRVNFRDDDGA